MVVPIMLQYVACFLVAAAGLFLLMYFSCRQQQAKPVIRCVIFDLDDTLWDVNGVLNHATDMFHQHLVEAYPRLGQQFPPAEYYKVYGIYQGQSASWTEIRKLCLRHCALATGYDPEQVIKTALEVFEGHRNNVQPYVFPGVRDTLLRLRSKGYKIGSISNGTADIRNIDYFKDMFEFHFSPAQSGVRKPDPGMFNMALEATGIPAHEILYVGDNYEHDVIGPLQVGMHAAWINKSSPPCKGSYKYSVSQTINLDAHTRAMDLACAQNLTITSAPTIAQVEKQLDVWRAVRQQTQ